MKQNLLKLEWVCARDAARATHNDLISVDLCGASPPTDRARISPMGYYPAPLLSGTCYKRVSGASGPTGSGEPMATYRLYCIDGDGRIAKGEWLEADTDEEAIGKAKALRHPLPWELWLEQRQVAKIPAQKPEPRG